MQQPHKMNKIQNVMLIGMARKLAKSTHTSVWIAQDTRKP